MDTIVDWLFLCDIIIILNWAVIEGDDEDEDADEHLLITSRKDIFIRYLKGSLIIDVIAIFPFYLF